jgi:ABC-type nitrate/sulfonate/bicarbonate transport system substrate-binding protein
MNEPQRIRLQGFTLASIVILGVITILVIVLVSINGKPSAPAYTGPMMHLSAGIVGEYSSLSIIAEEKGYFKANGLDVTLKDYISGPPAVADMLAGKLDLATAADFVGVINSFTHPELRIVAAQARADSFFLVARQDRGLNNAADLKGKRIGFTRDTAGHFFLGQYLTFNHLSLSDVTLTDLPPDKLVDALADGSLDAIVTFNPHISDAQKRLGSNAHVWPLQGDEKLSPLLYANSSLTSQKPEAIRRYLRALIEAEDYIQMNNDAARGVVGSYLKFDDNYMQAVWSNITFDVSLDQDLLINMDDEARWAIENKITPVQTAPDYLQFIYFNSLEAVKPEGITVIR